VGGRRRFTRDTNEIAARIAKVQGGSIRVADAPARDPAFANNLRRAALTQVE
jgi:hypothetical protein